VYCRVLYAFADVPLDAGRLVVSQVTSTVLQEHQRRSQETLMMVSMPAIPSSYGTDISLAARTKARKKGTPMPH
jgi:hypothetical protein